MANTLKFGNGEWATKKGSTLAYNDEGGNFKPLPFTFDRASSATRVNKDGLIEVVSNNEPRIDFLNDSKGALLLEPSRSNYILKSDDVLSTYQSQNGDVSDASEPINGFNNSIQIEYDASNSLVYKRDFNPTIGTEYTISLFVQMNDNSEPIHTVDENSGDFCLINNGLVVSDASDIKTERLGSTNVYRVSATRTATSTNNRFGIIKYSTQSSKGFKVTGFQLEVGYATSHIPTQGSSETRVAETCEQTPPSGVIGQTEGSVYFEYFKKNQNLSFISIDNDTSDNRIFIESILGGNSIRTRIISGGIASVDNTSGSVLVNGVNKVALGYDNNDVVLYHNGIQIFTDNTATIPSTSILRLGVNVSNSFQLSDGINEVKLYNTRLSNTELQALTKI